MPLGLWQRAGRSGGIVTEDLIGTDRPAILRIRAEKATRAAVKPAIISLTPGVGNADGHIFFNVVRADIVLIYLQLGILQELFEGIGPRGSAPLEDAYVNSAFGHVLVNPHIDGAGAAGCKIAKPIAALSGYDLPLTTEPMSRINLVMHRGSRTPIRDRDRTADSRAVRDRMRCIVTISSRDPRRGAGQAVLALEAQGGAVGFVIQEMLSLAFSGISGKFIRMAGRGRTGGHKGTGEYQ